MKEAYRDQRGLPVFEAFWQDVRYGARQLRKNPGFNEALARRLWPEATAVGKILISDGESEVVGVVGNVRHAGLDRATEPELYLPRCEGRSDSGAPIPMILAFLLG